ncbi:signal peptide peptidase-like 2A isoform X2 [Amblyomma americanum]
MALSTSILTAAYVQVLVVFFATPAQGANPIVNAVLLVKAADASTPVAHCAVYVPAVKDIAKREEDAEYRPLLNVLNDTECDYERRSFEGKVVLLERCDNSSNDDIIQKAKSAKAAALVMTFNERRPIKDTTTTIKKQDIIVAFIKNSTGRQITKYEEKEANGTLVAKIFTRSTSLDWSFLVIWLMAVCTVMGGAYWSGISQYQQYQPKVPLPSRSRTKPKKISRSLRRPSEPDRKPKSSAVSVGVPVELSDFTDSINDMEEEFSVPISPKLVVMFVMHMSVMLLILYYFYRYLVHFIVVLFAMASAAALISCLEPLVNRINIGTSKVPKELAVCCQTRMEIRQVALLVFVLGVAIAWFLTRRNDSFGWILQDLLGIVFCVNMLKSFHLPNLKNRESVMVEVAKGGSVKEVLPMVIKFPRIYRGVYYNCFQLKFSILGLGDILAPGLLISYCHTFDLLALGRRFYYYIACVSYGLGMVATFIALELMRSAQPALLYLVPFTLIPTLGTAWFKGHLFAIWNGVRLPESSSKAEASSDPKTAAMQQSPGGHDDSGAKSATAVDPDNADGADLDARGHQGPKRRSKSPEDQGDEPSSTKDSSLPLQDDGLLKGGDVRGGPTDEDALAVCKHGTGSPPFSANSSSTPLTPSGPEAAAGYEECPEVVAATRKRFPWRVGGLTWEEQLSGLVLSQQRKNGVDTGLCGGRHATSPFPA